jgi:beta-phosphoglucomutase
MTTPGIKAVIFDMDGVITDTMPYHYRAWHKIFLNNGISVSKYDVYSREGQKGTESIREIFAHFGRKISTRTALSIIADKEALYKTIVRRRFIPGTRNLIKNLNRAGLRLGLVTGTARNEVEQTLPPAVLSRFEVVVTGSDVKNGKPSPEPYLKALKGLKISGAEAIVIENAPFGIRSAVSAGIDCYAVTTSLPRKYLKEANQIFDTIKNLERVLITRIRHEH